LTPAEFDTRRRYLGLSVDETAALCGVQDRTIRRWQNGTSPIPDDARAALKALEDAMNKAVTALVETVTNVTASGPVVLWRYRTKAEQDKSPHASSLPLGAHAMMIAWAADALEGEGIEVEIAWAE
jgi:transcriptional regulator with XRE-family HTH domain